jgi:hypothetical protein
MIVLLVAGICAVRAAEDNTVVQFRKEIQPILVNYCYDCHGDGMAKGNVAFDELKTDEALLNPDLWLKVLKNVRANIMPPEKKARPTGEEKEILEKWIKHSAFGIDPQNPDPGRVTVRRLNRVEYRNTIRDLTGVDFRVEVEFPPDDTGHGFDNIADVLTLPPMLMEKYLEAAKTIVARAVPTSGGSPAEEVIPGGRFRRADSNERREGPLSLSYYEPASVSHKFRAKQAGRYQVILEFAAAERHVENQFDYNKCRLVFKADSKELLQKEYTREGNRSFRHELNVDWQAGERELVFELQPLTPDQKQVRSLALRIDSVTVRGPMEKEHWVRPRNYERFFVNEPPADAAGRRQHAREVLASFARKAFRRPVDDNTLDRLTALAQSVYDQPGKTFEAGVSQAMVAVLASPRFLFREEGVATGQGKNSHPLIDEYALASRLSYFLWSTMPDDELFRLAAEGNLRKNLSAQVTRMLADRRSEALVRNFVGQWLQARDIENVPIEARAVLAREEGFNPDRERNRRRFRELRDKPEESLTPEEKEELAKIRASFRGFGQPRVELTGDLRRAMRQETEKVFEYILREDRSLLELVDSDYTFLNERLAKHYGVENVTGDELRRVTLPPDSPRGGVLGQGTVLAVTSNPTRTSPVKRGVFILENILGLPPPPPPPDIPPLEDAAKNTTNRSPTLKELLALHREQPLCSSCHNRMDPLGLALENFNAMGMWRETEQGQPIDATGKLITGERFSDVKDLKRILATKHQLDFYHALTEKLMTYALGRGVEYYDIETVDQIVARLEQTKGRPSALLMGIVESAPFQKTRNPSKMQNAETPRPAQQRADARSTP